jgi:hypothetical protein
MSLISAGSISLDSTFKADLFVKNVPKQVHPKNYRRKLLLTVIKVWNQYFLHFSVCWYFFPQEYEHCVIFDFLNLEPSKKLQNYLWDINNSVFHIIYYKQQRKPWLPQQNTNFWCHSFSCLHSNNKKWTW